MTDPRRREHTRAPVSITGDLRTSLDPSFSRMMMEDLSMGGAFVRTRFPLPEGVEVNLDHVPDELAALRLRYCDFAENRRHRN